MVRFKLLLIIFVLCLNCTAKGIPFLKNSGEPFELLQSGMVETNSSMHHPLTLFSFKNSWIPYGATTMDYGEQQTFSAIDLGKQIKIKGLNRLQHQEVKRIKREFMAGVKEKLFSPSNILLTLISTVLRNKIPVVLHDSQTKTLNVLNEFLMSESYTSAIILDITDTQMFTENWLDDLNNDCFVNILLFSSNATVQKFADGLPTRIWTPSYLLLVNVEPTVNGWQLLSHESFTYSPHLSLLQPHPKGNLLRFIIFTYESFHPGNKIISHGIFDTRMPSTLHELFPDRFPYFYGYNFHLASWTDDFPYVFPGNTVQEASGISVFMLKTLASKFNFTYTIYETTVDQMWGSIVNGSWVGMIGELYRREKDLCVNVMSIVEDRFHAVDFSVPYFTDSYSFVIVNPVPPPRWWSIVFPFTWQTWTGVVLSIVVVAYTLMIFLKVKATDFSISGVFLEVVRSILGQGAQSLSPATSIRIFEGIWWLIAMILSICYTGNLTAYIMVAAKAHRMTSLRELADSHLTTAMIDYGNFVPGALKISNDTTLRKLGEKMVLIPDYNYPLGFQNVVEGKYAFVEGTEYMVYMVIKNQKNAETYFLPEPLYPVHVGWIYPKKTPWKHKFDPILQNFVESGLCHYWKKLMVEELKKKEGDHTHEEANERITRALSIQDVQGIFILYGLGIGVSVVVGLAEVVWHSVRLFAY